MMPHTEGGSHWTPLHACGHDYRECGWRARSSRTSRPCSAAEAFFSLSSALIIRRSRASPPIAPMRAQTFLVSVRHGRVTDHCGQLRARRHRLHERRIRCALAALFFAADLRVVTQALFLAIDCAPTRGLLGCLTRGLLGCTTATVFFSTTGMSSSSPTATRGLLRCSALAVFRRSSSPSWPSSVPAAAVFAHLLRGFPRRRTSGWVVRAVAIISLVGTKCLASLWHATVNCATALWGRVVPREETRRKA